MPRLLRILAVLGLIATIGAVGATVGFPSTHRRLMAFFHQDLGLSLHAATVGTNLARKGFHVVAYAVLAGLTWWALPRRAGRAGFTIGIALLVAFADEGIQWLAPGRTGSFRDIVIDLAGILVGLWVVSRLGRANHEPHGAASSS